MMSTTLTFSKIDNSATALSARNGAPLQAISTKPVALGPNMEFPNDAAEITGIVRFRTEADRDRDNLPEEFRGVDGLVGLRERFDFNFEVVGQALRDSEGFDEETSFPSGVVNFRKRRSCVYPLGIV